MRQTDKEIKTSKKKKIRKKGLLKWGLGWLGATAAVVAGVIFMQGHQSDKLLAKRRSQMTAMYGENQRIEGDYDRALAVTCHNGTFVGRQKNGVRSYKGIPYAVPPVGQLRWKAPVPAKKDDKVYQAYYFGKSPIQTEAETELSSLYPQGEDCLTLNIWSDKSRVKGGKTVMVFFPGGGFGWGGTADPIYDGHNFAAAQKDVILVTVNYRIGMMGFMDFSEVRGGENYAQSGNLGLLDQVCALKWIHQNISKFGGDPNNVTIFGESAGGSSVSLLPFIKDAKGLFKRAIAQSGSHAFTYSRTECQTLTRKLLEETGAKNMAGLRALSEADLKKVNEQLNDYNNFPERDGVVLPKNLYRAYAQGKAADIDMMIGTNADEARYWIGEVGGFRIYQAAVPLLYKSFMSRIKPEDKGYARAFLEIQRGEDLWKKTEFFNDILFRGPAIYQAGAQSRNGAKTYMYYWTKGSSIPNYLAAHAVELAYVFGNTDCTIFTGMKADKKLSSTVQQMWVNFAKNSDPGTDEHAWEPYNEDTRQTMILGDSIYMKSDPLREQRMLIEPLLRYQFNGYYMMIDYALKVLVRDVLSSLIILFIVEGALFGGYKLMKRSILKKYAAGLS